MLIVITAFPIFTYLFLKKVKNRLQNEDFKARFQSLYLNVDTDIDKAILMVTLFVIRRFLFAISIIFLSGWVVTQLFI